MVMEKLFLNTFLLVFINSINSLRKGFVELINIKDFDKGCIAYRKLPPIL